MSEMIDGVECFVAYKGSFVDAVVRADTEADWVQGAVFYGLIWFDDEGDQHSSAGVNISVIGPVEVEPPVYDETGAQITPAVIDRRYHVNMRLSGPALEVLDESGALKWQTMAKNWSVLGAPDPVANANESARVLHNVALIDPASIRTPLRVWA